MSQYNFKLELRNAIVRIKTFQETQENNHTLGFDIVVYD